MDPKEDQDYADIEDLLASSEDEVERGTVQVQAELDRNRVHLNWCRTRLARLRGQRRRASRNIHIELARLITA